MPWTQDHANALQGVKDVKGSVVVCQIHEKTRLWHFVTDVCEVGRYVSHTWPWPSYWASQDRSILRFEPCNMANMKHWTQTLGNAWHIALSPDGRISAGRCGRTGLVMWQARQETESPDVNTDLTWSDSDTVKRKRRKRLNVSDASLNLACAWWRWTYRVSRRNGRRWDFVRH